MDGSDCNGTHCRAGKSHCYFDTAIADAERLLELFDKLSKPEQQANEVLKRAALVMTLTAWETFIESWLAAHACQNLIVLKGSFPGN